MSHSEPESYAGGRFSSPGRATGRVQTKSSLPALRVMRLGSGLITHSPKTFYDYGNRVAALHTPLRCNEDDDDDDERNGPLI